jgi:hypothetical protein
MIGIIEIPHQTAFAAATAVTVNKVDYVNENLIVNNKGNSKIYYATEIDAGKGNWEIIDVDSNSTSTTLIDISWLSPTVENIIKIKGDGDQTQSRIIIKERTKKLDISINYSNINIVKIGDPIALLVNIMSSEGNGNEPLTFTNDLEWRKGDGGSWQAAALLTKELLEKFQIKGTYLYFRIKAIDDTSTTTPLYIADGSKGRRASSEVKVKIVKKTLPMVVGIDGEDFTAAIKYGNEYRITSINGVTQSPPWIQVTDRAVKILPLSEILNQKVLIGTNYELIDGTITAKYFPAMEIEVRDYATSKTSASKITKITLNAQRTLSGAIFESAVPVGANATDKNIYIGYNGIKNMTITIPSATPEEPFEYCIAIVKPGYPFEPERAVWTSVTKNTEVKILSSKAIDGGKLYVRQKEVKSKSATKTQAAVAFKLASTYLELNNGIIYPSIPEITDKSYTFTKGAAYASPIKFTITLNVTGRKPFETKIKNIKLGTKEIKFTPSVTTVNNVSTMEVTLLDTSLAAMTNCYNKAITITYMNGTVDKTSIKLTIQNPTPAASLTATAAASAGTAGSGTTITLVNTAGTGNSFYYTIDSAAVTGKNTADKLTAVNSYQYTGLDITGVTAGQYITIYEVTNTDKYIVKYKSILITEALIK